MVVGAVNESSRAAGVNGDQGDNSLPQAGAAYAFAFDSAETIRPLTSITRTPSGLRVTLPPGSGRVIGIEYSPDMSAGSWVELGNFFPRDCDLVFVDPDIVRLGRKPGFFRAFLRQ